MGQSTWGLWNTSNSSLDTNPSSKNSSKTHTKCESVSPSTLARPVSRSVTPVGNCTASSMASSQTARCLPTRPSAAVTTLSTPFSPRLVPVLDSLRCLWSDSPSTTERSPSSNSPSTQPLRSPPLSSSHTTVSSPRTPLWSTLTALSWSITKPSTTSADETWTSSDPPTPT